MSQMISAVYGDYDCEANSVLFWLQRFGFSVEPFLHFNWDFYMDEEKDILRGSIPINEALSFIEMQYGIGSNQIALNEASEGDPLIIPVNAFRMAHANEYYLQQDWLHYFPAMLATGHAFDVWDHVLKYTGSCSYAEINRGWEICGIPVYSLIQLAEAKDRDITMRSNVTLMNEEKYEDTLKLFVSRLRRMVNDSADISCDPTYKKYYGNLQSINKSRQLHFESSPVSLKVGEKIVYGWRRVLKSYARMMVLGEGVLQETIQALEEVSHEELNYVYSLK